MDKPKPMPRACGYRDMKATSNEIPPSGRIRGTKLRIDVHKGHVIITRSYPSLELRLTAIQAFDAASILLQAVRRVHSELGLKELLEKPFDFTQMSCRVANYLRHANIKYVGELVQKTESEILRTKNFGRKSLKEIKEILAEMGLSLGKKLDGWKPPVEDVNDANDLPEVSPENLATAEDVLPTQCIYNSTQD